MTTCELFLGIGFCLFSMNQGDLLLELKFLVGTRSSVHITLRFF